MATSKRPVDFPDWATGATNPVDAGTDSGAATKVKPASGMLATGWRAGSVPAASYQNWAMGMAGQWTRYLGSIKAQNWTKSTLPADGSSQSNAVFVDDINGRIYSLGPQGGTSGCAFYSRTGEDWTQVAAAVSLYKYRFGCSNPAGVVLLYGDSFSTAHILRSTNGTTFTSITTIPSGFNGSCGIVWDAVHSLFIMIGTLGATGKIATSPDGITWTARTVSGGQSGAAFTTIVTNGLGMTIALAPGYGGYAYSTDGVTWQTGALLSTNNITYCADRGLWVAQNGNINNVITSPDGINWTVLGATVTTSFSQNSTQGLANDGGLIVGLCTGAGGRNGINFCWDNDPTQWATIDLGANNGPTLQQIQHARGQFYVVASDGSLYRSLRVEAPTANNPGG